jgi:enterochelin esterase-like enzyme
VAERDLLDAQAPGSPTSTSIRLRVDDLLIQGNRALHDALEADGIPQICEEFAGGREWPDWQEHVASTLQFAGHG